MMLLDTEYRAHLKKWKMLTNFVLPQIKYSLEPNEEGRNTSYAQMCVQELVESYTTLCTPPTKEWLSVISTQTPEDNLETSTPTVSRDAFGSALLQDITSVHNNEFYNKFQKALQSAVVFGQSVMHVGYKDNFIQLRNIPQYRYRIYQRDSNIYYFARKIRTVKTELKKEIEASPFNAEWAFFDDDPTNLFVTYLELWINNEFFDTNQFGYPQTNETWTKYILLYNENYSSMSLNGEKKNSDFQVGTEGFRVATRKVHNFFPYAYMLFEKDDEDSYGISNVNNSLETILSYDAIKGLVLDDIEGLVKPPLILSSDMANKIDIRKQHLITVPNSKGGINNNVMPLTISGRGSTVAMQEAESLAAQLRRNFYLEDLQFVANTSKQLTQESFFETYRDRITTIAPMIVGIIANIVSPLVDKMFELLQQNVKQLKDTKDIKFLPHINPPILRAEKLFSKGFSVDLLIKRLVPIAQVDPSVFDIINTDAHIRNIVNENPELSEFLRTEEEIQQLREQRSQQAGALADSEAQKNIALANKHNAQAREEGFVPQAPPQAQQQQMSADQQVDADLLALMQQQPQ